MQRSIAYVAVSHPQRRAQIAGDLAARGWTVNELPTGAHLLAALAEVIDGTATELPEKIIVEARARGITGTSIAAGLAALGLSIPVEVIDDPPDGPPPDLAPSAGRELAACAA